MMEKAMDDFLNRFLLFFGAKIDGYLLKDDIIRGTILWTGEDEQQEFELNGVQNILSTPRINELLDYLQSGGVLDGDKIIISRQDLINKLSASTWTIEEAEQVINTLCKVRIYMIDNAEKTDFLFVHF